jgi:response regulator RpfG family c-di-GMP phosphodiesterase
MAEQPVRHENSPSPGNAGPADQKGKETILLVEDEEGVLDLMREILEAEGYKVLTASTGPAALRLAAAYPGPIHLLLTDVVMPEMSGPELAQQLRRSRPETKLLFASGYAGHPSFRNEVVNFGGAFLQKPIAPGVLARKVREVLDESN